MLYSEDLFGPDRCSPFRLVFLQFDALMANPEIIYAINDEFVRLGVSQDFYLHEGLSCENSDGVLVVCSDHRSLAIAPEITLTILRQLTPPSKMGFNPSQVWDGLVAASVKDKPYTAVSKCA